MPLHPVVEAIFIRKAAAAGVTPFNAVEEFCEEFALSEETFRAWLRGEARMPAVMLRALEHALGQPRGSLKERWETQARALRKQDSMIPRESDDEDTPKPTAARSNAVLAMARKNRKASADHPFVKWLDAQGKTVAQWAAANKVNKRTAQAWLGTGESRRMIPPAIAEKIERESSGLVPAASWNT